MSLNGKPNMKASLGGPERRRIRHAIPSYDSLEARQVLSSIQTAPVPAPNPLDPQNSTAAYIINQATVNPPAVNRDATPAQQLTPSEVEDLLNRASAATPDQSAIIVVMDRGGRLLGVRAESGVSPTILNDPAALTFAVDGAMSEARTGAFFGNNEAPLTSRTIQDISQSTMITQEVNSNPNITDPNSTAKGPGIVAPIGIKGHFPPGVPFTPQVDLFQIELTNRDTTVVPSTGQVRPNRFNVPDQYIPANITAAGDGLAPPDSYGYLTGIEPNAQPRGIGTLPGGIPIQRNTYNAKGQVTGSVTIGGIGVFYPGTTGFASAENSKLNQVGYDPTQVDKSLEAELVSFAALGGAQGAKIIVGHSTNIGTYAGVPPVTGLDLLPINLTKPGAQLYQGRIDLVGITLDVFGPNGNQGPINLFKDAPGFQLTKGTVNGIDLPITAGQSAQPFTLTASSTVQPTTAAEQAKALAVANGVNTAIGAPAATPPTTPPTTGAPANTKTGTIVPSGWLVTPHDGTGITAADVYQMVANGILRAARTRAAIRLPLGRAARMVFAVSDLDGNIVGLYRTPDATMFSIDVAVAKARNVAYYNNAQQLQPQDQVPGLIPGTALTNRTFRYLSLPHFPEGIDVYPQGPFSILNDNSVTGAPKPISAYQSVLGYDAFNPQTNFHAPTAAANQNGIVFFPGASGVYKTINGRPTLVGGLGVSGDGVDQDDVVTYSASLGFRAPNAIQVDHFKVRGVRLPYMKFNRNPLL